MTDRNPGDAQPQANDAEQPAPANQPRGRRRGRRVLGWVLLALGAAILISSAWVGWWTYQAYRHLQSASNDVSELQAEIRNVAEIDPVRTGEIVGRLQMEAAAARSAVDDPLVRLAAALPLIGPNLAAIDEVTVTVDGLASEVMPSLVQIAGSLQPADLAPRDGRIDLAPIVAASPLLQRADQVVDESLARVAAIDRSSVVEAVDQAVGQLASKLTEASELTETAARVARLLPPMLGADGPRTYLVVFQNLAEPRATGGIFGSYAVVRADQGAIEILDQAAASRSIGFFPEPVETLPPETIALYSELMAQYPQDVNFTPDFPTAARLFATMYTERGGEPVDGVMAIDPVALSYTLEGTGAVDVGEGVVLTSENVAQYLLADAYASFAVDDQERRDDFLARATGLAFATVMSGDGDPRVILEGLQRAMGERRLLVWSTHDGEQADLTDTALGGALDSALERSTVGVFLNDGTGAKLGYYLRNSVAVTGGSCQPDGRQLLDLHVTMTNTAPASGLPDYVVGLLDPTQPYVLRTNLLIFAPVGGQVVGATRDGQPWPLGSGVDHFHPVGPSTVELLSGQSTQIVVQVLTGPGDPNATGPVTPQLLLTPGVAPWEVSVDEHPPCRPAGG